MRRQERERGAVAVEFALVMPLLLMIIFSIIELGHAYNVQISVTHAAREAARSMAVAPHVWGDAVDAAEDSSPSLDPGNLTLIPTPNACISTSSVEVTAQYPLPGITGLLPAGITVTGRAAMQCGG